MLFWVKMNNFLTKQELTTQPKEEKDKEAKYHTGAAKLSQYMPCYWPQVWIDKINQHKFDEESEKEINEEEKKKREDALNKCEELAGGYFKKYFALFLIIMFVYQYKREKEWGGR